MKTYIMLIIAMLFSTMANASVATTSTKYNAYAQQVMLDRFDSIKGELYEASITTGINMNELVAIGSLESKLKNNVRPKRGTAQGVLQYTNSTWKNKRKQYAEELGVPANAHQTNLKANLTIGGKDLQDTKASLIARTHLTEETLTLGDVYMSHFLGEDGAVKVINSYSHKPLNQIVTLHAGNTYYYKPNGQVRTAREMRQYMDKLVKEESRVYEEAIMHYQVKRIFSPVHQLLTVLQSNPVKDVLARAIVQS
ncbi:transglycosylase [Aeromonas phage D3]|uniref:Lytic transglycosylase n=3 Tax=Ludhianavirus TaxID=3044751 RepID=A0A514TVR3_9CAUD|nr:transglycosylase [Aeromonas phage LAh10]YP_010668604.1 transglycosylase [Aeromonas phage D3]YP_010668870.1 transglycosylase [Aeromonas phage D6]QEP52428.1 lytic transglycosylase [Aeromonas phage D9]QDH47107.1 putative lytic transglycosylase [Aeromonas phage LAh10]QDJ97121.1 hypothetical protein D3_0123 [Aeromonas phage D3]QDJ97282.1 hypothetical protein D6_0122 [Aeromonas phage D6]